MLWAAGVASPATLPGTTAEGCDETAFLALLRVASPATTGRTKRRTTTAWNPGQDLFGNAG